MTTHGISTCLGCSLAEAVCSVKADSYVLQSTAWRPWTWEVLYLKQLKKKKKSKAWLCTFYEHTCQQLRWATISQSACAGSREKPLWQYYLRIYVSRISTWLPPPDWFAVEWKVWHRGSQAIGVRGVTGPCHTKKCTVLKPQQTQRIISEFFASLYVTLVGHSCGKKMTELLTVAFACLTNRAEG